MSLYVKALNGHLVKGKDMIVFKKDPYCVLQVGNEIRKTRIHENGGQDPVWNEQFTFGDLSNILRITLCDDDRIKKQDVIGQT